MQELDLVDLNVMVVQKESELNATDLNARAMNELDLAALNVAVLQKENELNATDLNERAMHELDLVDFNVVVVQKENELNATDLNERAMHELDLVDLDVAVLQKENELNATDSNARAMHDLDLAALDVAVLQKENELNATDLNEGAMHELGLADLNVVVLQKENELNTTDLNERASYELDLVDLNVVVLQKESELNATDLNARAIHELDLAALNELDLASISGVHDELINATNVVFKAQHCPAMRQIQQVGLKYQLMLEIMTFEHKDLKATALLSNAPILLNTHNAMGILLILRNRPQHNKDEHPMTPHYHVESSNLHEQLEEAEQQAYDHDMDQMDDDIRCHLNDETDRIMESFEQLDHSNSDDNPEIYGQDVETTDVFYRHSQNCSQDSSGDDIDENTDTEDGVEDLIGLTIKHEAHSLHYKAEHHNQATSLQDYTPG
jgi:hypothetical protein